MPLATSRKRALEDPRERLRRKYLPSRVRLLFVGESPPASGRFFYQRDSGLYRAMRDAYRAVYPSLDGDSFLPAFQASGCYLIDLCLKPVDDLPPKARRQACRSSEPSLSRAIHDLQPLAIAILLRSIEPNVIRAADQAGYVGPLLHLPYPGRWARLRAAFLELLTPTLIEMATNAGWPRPSQPSH